MREQKWILAAILCSLWISLSGAEAQEKIPPLSDSEPVHIVMGSGPGSGIDRMARTFVDIAGSYTDQTFAVEDRSGGNGLVAYNNLLNARPDGMTILAFSRFFTINFRTQPEMGNPLEKLHYIGITMYAPAALYTNKEGQWGDAKSAIEWAKSNPGQQKWGGGASVGSIDWMMTRIIADKLDIDIQYVPFDDGGSLAAAVMGQHVPLGVGDMGDVVGRTDRLEPLVVAANEGYAQFPDLPTFKDLGLDVVEQNFRGFVALKDIPEEAKAFYDKVFVQVLADPRWAAYVESQVAPTGGPRGAEMEKIVMDYADAALPYLREAGVVK